MFVLPLLGMDALRLGNDTPALVLLVLATLYVAWRLRRARG